MAGITDTDTVLVCGVNRTWKDIDATLNAGHTSARDQAQVDAYVKAYCPGWTPPTPQQTDAVGIVGWIQAHPIEAGIIGIVGALLFGGRK
jgi:hypothetical protein